MKKHLALILTLLACVYTAAGQTETDQTKYFEPVPTVDGKIVFTRTIKSSLPPFEIYEKTSLWGQNNYSGKDADNRILYQAFNEETSLGQVAAQGQSVVVVGRKLLSPDKATMNYRIVVETGDGEAKVTIRQISYLYFNGKDEEKLTAEEMISDKVALSRNRDKLTAFYGKFRTATIDEVDSIVESLDKFINYRPGNSNDEPVVKYIYIDSATGEAVSESTAALQSLPAIAATDPVTKTSTSIGAAVATAGAGNVQSQSEVVVSNIHPSDFALSAAESASLRPSVMVTKHYSAPEIITASGFTTGMLGTDKKPIITFFIAPDDMARLNGGDKYTAFLIPEETGGAAYTVEWTPVSMDKNAAVLGIVVGAITAVEKTAER